MSVKKILLTDPRPGKTIILRSEEAEAASPEVPEVETALRAIREKIDAIGSHLDRSVAVLARLEAKLGEAS